MAAELIFNVGLLVFFVYCFFFVGGIIKEPYPNMLDAAEWPRILLGLLIICLIANIVKIYMGKKSGESFKINFKLKEIVKSKFFVGSALMLIYSIVLDYAGFITSSIIFFALYSYLLGQRNWKKLIFSSLFSVVALYVIFNGMLDIMLPRGIGAFRNFALFLETLI